MLRPLIICAAILASGIACHNSYKQNVTALKPGVAPMTSRTGVLVAMPEDAIDKKESVPASGKRCALSIHEAFLRHTKNVKMSTFPETLTDSIEHARRDGMDYVAFPTILEWKERPTEWTGVRDRLELQIDIVDTASGEVVRTAKLEGVSRWMTDGGDATQDLLTDPVDKFVRSLFRVVMTPAGLPK